MGVLETISPSMKQRLIEMCAACLEELAIPLSNYIVDLSEERDVRIIDLESEGRTELLSRKFFQMSH